MLVNKACPVVLRETIAARELLVFEHPLAGIQLVKGTIEPGEPAERAALRELSEEFGISLTSSVRELGTWASGHKGQVWSFWVCEPLTPPPDNWVHPAVDDGGHLFRFFWHPLFGEVSGQWHPVYQRALRFIQNAV
jgi:8-oxo-dGTP pyrophosphatase MutT (NUDIX family)